jgi:aspartate carbamoyltransferase regulatory subunit
MRMALILKLLDEVNVKGKYDKKIAVKADGKCKNSHCILTTEQELEPKFFVDGNGDLRCFYCDGKIE